MIAAYDAPRAVEILVLFPGASLGRFHARLGGLKEADVTGDDGLR